MKANYIRHQTHQINMFIFTVGYWYIHWYILLGLLRFYYSISCSVLVGFSQKTVVSVIPSFGFI